MSKTAVSQEKRDLYDRLLATHPDVERKGRNLLYTSVNGHMFTVFSTDAMLGIRLPKEERVAFMEKYDTTLLATYGAVMREYVTVPDALLADTKTLSRYLAMSYDYVRALKPKPTTKPAGAKAAKKKASTKPAKEKSTLKKSTPNKSATKSPKKKT